MVDDMAVLVPSTMPDHIGNVTFNSFGVLAHCQPVVDCLVDYTQQSSLYCPSFNPPYNISRAPLPEEVMSSVNMLNLTNNALSYLGYPLDSVLNPYGARVILYWPNFHEAIFLPADNPPGWYILPQATYYAYISTCNMTAYNVSLSYSTLNGNNTYAFASPPVRSNFNTTSALFAAFDYIYQTHIVDYLETTLATSLTPFHRGIQYSSLAKYVLRHNGLRVASLRTRRQHRWQCYYPKECQQVSLGTSISRTRHPLHLRLSCTRDNHVLRDVVISGNRSHEEQRERSTESQLSNSFSCGLLTRWRVSQNDSQTRRGLSCCWKHRLLTCSTSTHMQIN